MSECSVYYETPELQPSLSPPGIDEGVVDGLDYKVVNIREQDCYYQDGMPPTDKPTPECPLTNDKIGEWYDLHYKTLVKYANTICSEQGEDIVNEVFTRLLNRRPSLYDCQNYLLKAVKHQAISRNRSPSYNRSDPTLPDELVELVETMPPGRMTVVIDDTEETQSKILWLRSVLNAPPEGQILSNVQLSAIRAWLANPDIEDYARAQGESPNAVHARLYRARRKLREVWTKQDQET